MVNDTCADWPGAERHPLEPFQLARRLARRGRVAQVQLGDVAARRVPMLVTVADTCTSCVPFTAGRGSSSRPLNANFV